MSLSSRSLAEIAEAAGAAILEVYNRPAQAVVERKADDSPLTEADTRSHEVIVAALAKATPEIPVVSEEDDGNTLPVGAFWLVDPLDGTKEFVKRTGEFTVNIALIDQGTPIAGVVHAPVLGTTWVTTPSGSERWHAGEQTPLAVTRPAEPAALRLVASRDHAGPQVQALLERMPGATTLSMGSSLKFCLVAEGRADLYYRDGPTMPWDTAAAHAVLRAAGGEVYAVSGEPLRYVAPRTLNPHFVAVGDCDLPWGDLLTSSTAS